MLYVSEDKHKIFEGLLSKTYKARTTQDRREPLRMNVYEKMGLRIWDHIDVWHYSNWASIQEITRFFVLSTLSQNWSHYHEKGGWISQFDGGSIPFQGEICVHETQHDRPCPVGTCAKTPGGCPCVQPDGNPGAEHEKQWYSVHCDSRFWWWPFCCCCCCCCCKCWNPKSTQIKSLVIDWTGMNWF